MSDRNETLLRPSRVLRDKASALVDQIHAEMHPDAGAGLLIRVAMVEGGAAALAHLDTFCSNCACEAVADAVVLMARLIAVSSDEQPEVVLKAIMLGCDLSKGDDIGVLRIHDGPRKEAS